jgi:hypothetical protein
MVNDEDLIVVTDGVHNLPLFVLTRAPDDTAFHDGRPLCVGVSHFGGLGSAEHE